MTLPSLGNSGAVAGNAADHSSHGGAGRGPRWALTRRSVRLVLFVTVSTSGIRVGVSTPTLTRHEHAHHAPHCSSNRHSCTSKTKHDVLVRSTSERDSAAWKDQTHAALCTPASQHACWPRLHGRTAPNAAAAATMRANLSAKARQPVRGPGAQGRAVGRRGGTHRDIDAGGGAHVDQEGPPPRGYDPRRDIESRAAAKALLTGQRRQKAATRYSCARRKNMSS